jgi:N-acetylmuramic acid 6-phosphate etherase
MSVKKDSTQITTERVNGRSAGIDTWPSSDILTHIWRDQRDGVNAVEGAIPQLEQAAKAVANRLRKADSRLIYVGAGTSGVVAGLDGIELPCTFGWPEDRLLVYRADDADNILRIQTAGDDGISAANDAFLTSKISDKDVVIAVSASGNTSYTCVFTQQAKAAGALVVSIANNKENALLKLADHSIFLDTGPEVIAGSTRLKAGTSQKVALNMLSTLTMTLLGHVYDGMMVNVVPENDKLRVRAARMVATIAEVNETEALHALNKGGSNVKAAVLITKGLTPNQAQEALAETGQDLRKALILVADR